MLSRLCQDLPQITGGMQLLSATTCTSSSGMLPGPLLSQPADFPASLDKRMQKKSEAFHNFQVLAEVKKMRNPPIKPIPPCICCAASWVQNMDREISCNCWFSFCACTAFGMKSVCIFCKSLLNYVEVLGLI